MSRRPPLDTPPTVDIGPYRLAHRIAVGGMAEVFRALWPQAAGGDRAVVIKRLMAEGAADPEQRTMFEDEVRLGSRIDHPNVVSVIDHGLDDGHPYMVLEYVFGVDLDRLVRWLRYSETDLDLCTAVWITRQLLAGLEAVHRLRDERGGLLHVVHRDVSPSNVFLSVHGDVKLGDLGIAHSSFRGRGSDMAARAKGKLRYLSPEQVNGVEVDPRSDVFSAGAVLAELVTGQPLFSGATEISVLLAIRDGDLTPIHKIADLLPDGLGAVMLASLDRRRDERIPTAAHFREALAPFVTDDEAVCRARLGTLVVGALDADTSAAEHDALKQTTEHVLFDDVGDNLRYSVEREGEPIGEYRLADLVRAVTTGDVQPTDRLLNSPGDHTVGAAPEIADHFPSSARTPHARQLVELRETGERWDLSRRSMVSVLGEALYGREHGLLLCEHGHIRKEVYLVDGAPAFVTSNQPAELFGEALCRKGVLERHELDLALAALPHHDGRLGETLVAMGLLHPIELVHHLRDHALARLLSLFEWDSGHASLYRELERPPRAFRIDADPWVLLIRGVKRRMDKFGSEIVAVDDFVVRHGGVDSSAPSVLHDLWRACARPRLIAELETLAPTPEQAHVRIALLMELDALKWRGTGPEA